jgi:hypothetical protein
MPGTPVPQAPSRSFANGNGPSPRPVPDWVGAPAHWWLMV